MINVAKILKIPPWTWKKKNILEKKSDQHFLLSKFSRIVSLKAIKVKGWKHFQKTKLTLSQTRF